MSVRIQLDTVDGELFTATPLVIERGRSFALEGWAVDAESGAAPAIVGRIDACVEARSSRVVRRDVGLHFGNPALDYGGFVIALPTQLTLGAHVLHLGWYDDGGRFHDVARVAFTCVEARERTVTTWPRILVASAPKSGSTYTYSVLKHYFNVEDPPLDGQFSAWEQNFDTALVERLRGRAFVLHLHTKAHQENLAVMEPEQIVPVVTWRNLADTLVSLDDHIHKEGGSGVLLQTDDPRYLALPDQARYQMLIRYMVPWYVTFFLGWRGYRPAIFMRYEQLAVDPAAYFSTIIAGVGGGVDTDRLHDVLRAKMPNHKQRLNAGVNGRANQKMSDDTKALLEETLRVHFADLRFLIRELPWHEGPGAPLEPKLAAIG